MSLSHNKSFSGLRGTSKGMRLILGLEFPPELAVMQAAEIEGKNRGRCGMKLLGGILAICCHGRLFLSYFLNRSITALPCCVSAVQQHDSAIC